MSTQIELQAREANSAGNWDVLWTREGQESWRGKVLDTVYARVAQLIPQGSKVLDIGGGVGIFAKRLREDRGCTVTIWDISPAAIEMARAEGFTGDVVDLESICNVNDPSAVNVVKALLDQYDVILSTECLEHLSAACRAGLLEAARDRLAFFTVPNDRLGPEIEPQHTIQFTAMSFKRELQTYFRDVRVEVLGPCDKPFVPAFLLGVCNQPKGFKLSFTMPVRNEEKDIERVLASFRGAADEIVIGVDPRSTDNTRAIAAKYADVVFELLDPTGETAPEEIGKATPGKGVHFAWIRNQCMDKCTGDWIFMSEGHESLKKGTETLLMLDKLLPKGAKVGYVWRTGQGQRWAFPWLTNNHDKRLRYTRSTHNDLNIPDDVLSVKLPQVETWHFRDHAAEAARKAQRKLQNRVTLMDDWLTRESTHSLFYLASEWREFSKEKSLEYFHKFLESKTKIGDARYQARLIVAKELGIAALEAREKGDLKTFSDKLADARKVLIPATEDNWARSEHWLWLGDIAAEQELWEEAIQFYKYARTTVGQPPFCLWWVDDSCYREWPSQRLSESYANLGMYEESLYYAKEVLALIEGNEELQPLLEETKGVIAQLENVVNAPQETH